MLSSEISSVSSFLRPFLAVVTVAMMLANCVEESTAYQSQVSKLAVASGYNKRFLRRIKANAANEERSGVPDGIEKNDRSLERQEQGAGVSLHADFLPALNHGNAYN
ncbi:hypothetical protein PHYSODRAFT_288990 [Phytophthora sojae]|uniref:RxLR effector protein n=2 Tax=Phytophthora sojae TaxID=67593 RepID=G5ABW7_PHYSP|nr:hypothetical protein PHYSODRAFT_288990 [Phytophthora sojae]AEK81309.1 Avh425 [Phytophthora sojae]AEK81310.1 Avh425 [Phytophthora sojae]AEK81311.1 Avh425 [Phytophthora sojae]EGZ06842.1 hypothetical protein PHYSODRAFT_288990 [Phytophthora sojae]|eukprot:XP_009537606.1 hypothetical protein PHYSODRAFT_288990 [Phytophthora sojae]